jgi:superfamily II DNA or RNA helicase
MTSFDQLKPDAIIRSPLFPEPVKLIITVPMGEHIRVVGMGLETGQTYQPILAPADIASLQISPETRPFDGRAHHFRLGIEALRLSLAYEYDPYFALSIARIDPLPHQLEAVYDHFIKAPRIRFLLADDPGAGKTIMAGLLIQEMKARGLLKRILIITPANLTFQWQRELQDKFRQPFEVLNGQVLRAHYGSNPWQEKEQVITSISWVSRVEDAQNSLLRSRWDLIIVDEAHKMSAAGADSKTLAYQLGEKLSEQTDHYLLMTATPHKGDPHHFARFLQLLDRDVYGDVASLQEAMRRQEAPFYLRRVKEALVTFPLPDTGEVQKLFTQRHVRTVDFKIDDDEWEFYNALTQFVEEQSQQAAEEGTARGRAIGFTMAMLQRRFASSLYAVRRTLERMKARREKILADPEKYRLEQLMRKVPDDFDELPEEEQAAILAELEEVVLSVDPETLRAEILQLGRLAGQAQLLEAREVESKLLQLRETMTREGVFADPKMKLLIFTEHKDTLDYLAGDGRDGRPPGKLREWGLSVTQIHGGMKIGDRDTPGSRIFAEREFREDCQVLVATEAAGEGINLQFCWFMINYDIPWNPVRLEQRMGRIHRYGQEKDCLIINFVATNTVEGRVLQKLFERVRQIEKDLDPEHVGTVFNVLGDVFPSNQLERMIREMYASNHERKEQVLIERIVAEVDVERFRRITQSALEGLARRQLNLSSVLAKTAEARERRLVPEVIEQFFVQAGPLAGLFARPLRGNEHVYHVGRVPRLLLAQGAKLEARFGALGREYKDVTFSKEHLQADATLEWLTPGHPLFEAVRAQMWQQAQPDLERGAIFYDLNRSEAAVLDIFSATVQDGRAHPLHERLFVVETANDGRLAARPPTLFLDLIPAPAGVALPASPPPDPRQAEQYLVEAKLQAFLAEVRAEREKEVATVRRHLEISLDALINRQNERLGTLLIRQQEGDEDALLPANIKKEHDRLEELEARRDGRRRELEQERHCNLAHVRHLGRAWVLPHPDRDKPNLAPMVRDEAIEQIAVAAAIQFEQARGWQVEDVQAEAKGFDLISRNPANANQVRFIEVKGRAHVGLISLSDHEYRTAYRLKEDYWLYVAFNCATRPDLYPIQDPARLRWQPMQQVIQYRVEAEAILDAAIAQAAPPENPIAQAFQAVWQSRFADIGQFNILVEGLSDKVYLELAAQKYREAQGVDLLENGRVRIIAARGTKSMAQEFGLLQSLESEGIHFVVMLDGDEPGVMAAEAMHRFGARKNRHYFQLERPDYKDKAGKSWPVEIEDMLPWPLLEAFISQYPEAVEERFQRGGVQKVVILGRPIERDGQLFDYKMMLTEYVKREATAVALAPLITLLQKARQCLGLP